MAAKLWLPPKSESLESPAAAVESESGEEAATEAASVEEVTVDSASEAETAGRRS